MRYIKPAFILLLGLFLLVSGCKKDCKVIQADWSPTFLYHDGMAPEGVLLETTETSADSYSWDVEGNVTEAFRDTVNFETSGDFAVTLTTTEGKHECEQADIISIKDYPHINSNRALSFFESNGTNSRLIAKVVDFPGAENYVAISYNVGLPESGGGLDYDNQEKKLFASPLALLASCYPNNADLQFPVPPDTLSDRVIFDNTLDPDDGLVYFSGTENGNMFIRSAEAYGAGTSFNEVFTAGFTAEFVYLTIDRTNNVIYWAIKGTNVIHKLENGTDEVFLTGNAFYDLDFNNDIGQLFYVENDGGLFFIKNIDPLTGQITTDAGPINGEITYIHIDEFNQEIFWANNLEREIWSKRITFQMNSAQLHASNLGIIRGMAIGNFVED